MKSSISALTLIALFLSPASFAREYRKQCDYRDFTNLALVLKGKHASIQSGAEWKDAVWALLTEDTTSQCDLVLDGNTMRIPGEQSEVFEISGSSGTYQITVTYHGLESARSGQSSIYLKKLN